MALKGDRRELDTDITYTCASVAERGVGLCLKTAGSGVSLGDTAGVADLYTDPSGKKFLGVLMNDVVSLDETRYHRNFMKDQMLTGERVRILRKGYFTTDKVSGTPAAGDVAYLTANGAFSPTNGGAAATPKAGQFKSGKDEAGYATIEVNLPNL